MAASTLLPLGTQFFDSVGEPLSGGVLYFYTAGTTTPKNVYTTQAGTVALGTSVTLDGEGRIPSAGIWCLGSYRIIIKDANGVTINDIDTVNLYAPYDWSGLTASISDINSIAGSLGTAGVVTANKAVVVDASKDISSFGSLTGATLRATTTVRTPQISDANNVAAVTIASVSSQVNAVKVTPATTGNTPSIKSFGSDTNVDLALAGQGTGKVTISGVGYPTAAGTSGHVMTSDGTNFSMAAIPVATQVVKQVVTSATQTYSAITATIPYDDTIPQSTEGTEILTATITPTSASSTLLVFFIGQLASSIATTTAAIFRDSTANALAAGYRLINGSTGGAEMNALFVTASAASTSATTFKVRVGPDSGTTYVNGGTTAGRKYGGVSQCSLIIMEI